MLIVFRPSVVTDRIKFPSHVGFCGGGFLIERRRLFEPLDILIECLLLVLLLLFF